MPDAPFATLQNLADYCNVPVENVPTGQGNLALSIASGAIRNHCNWSISYQAGVQARMNGHGIPKLFLPTGYLVAVHMVALDFVPLTQVIWDGTTASQYGYTWNQSGWITRAPMWTWPKGDQRITVVYDHGYWNLANGSAPPGVESLPDSVIGITCSVAARMMDNPESVRTRRVGEESEMYDGAALTAVQLSPGDKEALKSVYIPPARR